MSDNDRYLWLGLEAGLWPSYVLEHRLASALADAGRQVTMIECQGALKAQCPVMTANHIPANASMKSRGPICSDCRHNATLVQARSRYSSLALDAYITDEIRSEVTEIIAGVTVANWGDLVVDGIPVGRYATYLTMLHHKLPDVASSDEAWAEYLADLRNSLLVLKALPALFDAIEPTHAVVYNPLYPTHRMFVEFARARGIRIVSVSAGNYLPSRYDTALVFPRIESSQTMVDSVAINGSLSLPCSEIEVESVSRHLAELIRGADPWVYSTELSSMSAAQIRTVLGIRPDSSVLTVLVSSPDETRSSILVGAEYMRDSRSGFSDIPEFIDQVLNAARRRPEVDFVIRLHPRLLPNKRERVSSPDLLLIHEALSNLPPNAVINSPEQELSLYDTIRISAAAVNQSSSAGLEFLALGLPVIQYDPARQNAYPPRFGPCIPRHDSDAFSEAIDTAIDSGWSLENSRKAFRWYSTILLRATLHFVELTGSRPPAELSEMETSVSLGSPPLSLRTLIPSRFRESVSRRLARAGRAQGLEVDHLSASWVSEWISRIDSLDPDSTVWEPLIVHRGHGDQDTETELLTRAVQEFISRVNSDGDDGVGALGSFRS